MNASEHIVDAYFRLVFGCFTLGDKKVVKGNNRQLDILAYHLKTREAFHIEVGVTHQTNWCVSLDELGTQFDRKFFGMPKERKGAAGGKTDFEKGKVYCQQILDTYADAGFNPEEVKRVWVCWIVKGADGASPIETQFYSKHLNQSFPIQILSLRDYILPRLQDKIGTANYDDELLRVLGFVKQRELQTAMTPKRAA